MNTEIGQQDGYKPRILVVEDDPSVRRSIQLFLRGRGFDVRTYATGDMLLLESAREDRACLITDYRLGESNGIALLTALRAQGWSGPAILMTAYPSREVEQSAHAAGFDLFLEKPLREQTLVSAIARLTRLNPDTAT